MGKRAALKKAFSVLGLVRLRWWTLPVRLYCFNYHRVGDARATEFDRNTFSCTADLFEEHVGFLRSAFELLNLEQVRALTQKGWVGRKPPALVTFDDGYIDNYEIAFPILKKHGAVATFFLPTAFVGTNRVPWWDEIAWLLRRAVGKRIVLDGARTPFAIEPGTCDQDIRRVLSFVKTRQLPLDHQVAEIGRACGDAFAGAAPEAQLFLNWNQAREMRAAGMDIGSHTHTHRLLAGLSAAEQKDELARSKDIAEGELGAPVTAVAYPVGSSLAYTAETCELAKQLGYALGFNFVGGNNRLPLERPLDIKRLSVSGGPSVTNLRSRVCFPSLFSR
jgi:peptidoglycan/xylan/chitin deacetylase (PgdA/CDA1 family)